MSSAGRGRIARRYDFRQSEGLDRAAVRSLRLLCEAFAHRVSGSLAGNLGTVAAVRLGGVQQQTWGQIAADMPDPACLLTAALQPLPGRVVVQLPLELATTWVELRLGGQVSEAPLRRALSEIEQELVRGTVEILVADLAAAVSVHRDIRPNGVAVLAGPHVHQSLRATDMCALVAFGIRLDDRVDLDFEVCFPLVLLRPLLESVAETAEDAVASPPEEMLARLAELPIGVQVRVATLRLPATALLDLAPGDVLPLPEAAGRPLWLVAGEQPFAPVRPLNRGGRLVAVLADPDSDPDTNPLWMKETP